jgi:hypothetical protein
MARQHDWIIGNGLNARDMVEQFKRWDGKAVNHNGT